MLGSAGVCKAYDGAKTSFLQYVVTIIQRNHPDMLPGFGTELDSVFPAERIQYDQWKEQIYTTEKHLESLKKIALNEARSQSNFEEEILLLRVTKPGMFVVQSLRILDDLKQKNEELAFQIDSHCKFVLDDSRSLPDSIHQPTLND